MGVSIGRYVRWLVTLFLLTDIWLYARWSVALVLSLMTLRIELEDFAAARTSAKLDEMMDRAEFKH